MTTDTYTDLHDAAAIRGRDEAGTIEALRGEMDRVDRERGSIPGNSNPTLEKSLTRRSIRLEASIIAMPVSTLEGVTAKLRWLHSELECLAEGFEGGYDLYADAVGTILKAVEGHLPADSVDPVFAVIRELWDAQKAFNESGDTPDDGPEAIRHSQAVESFFKTRATTTEGMAAKADAYIRFYRQAGDTPDPDVLSEMAEAFRTLAAPGSLGGADHGRRVLHQDAPSEGQED